VLSAERKNPNLFKNSISTKREERVSRNANKFLIKAGRYKPIKEGIFKEQPTLDALFNNALAGKIH
jgi:hypothetical protein